MVIFGQILYKNTLTLASGGGSSSPPQYVSVRHFYAVWDNELSFGDF